MPAVLAELQRELIVSNTYDGLAAARARGRVGGRRPKLNQRQLDQAQKMYDSGEHTVEEIADTFHVSRLTMYRHLTAQHDGRDCVLVVYRNLKTNTDTSNRRLGETGRDDDVQVEGDRRWCAIAPARRSRVKAIVYVAAGTVARVRSVDPELSKWREDDGGYADVPVSRKPLDDLQIAEQLPTLGLRNGDPRPHTRKAPRVHRAAAGRQQTNEGLARHSPEEVAVRCAAMDDGVRPWDAAAPLVRAAQSGDALAMDDLLKLVTPYVTRLSTPIAPDDTADAVQESLLAVFRGLRGLHDPQAFYGWARAVTVREAIRVARRTARETPAAPEEVARLRDLLPGVGGELTVEVRDLLARLPVQHRTVLVLRDLEGLDERTMAELLGIAEGTVKSRLNRARSSFRKAWTR
ncbi:sigma-70 family RNA polymerase sigma factor [Streptomyces sp. SAS_267]|uniref:sigma-70 family RNA polymerase sigma factor n=1 Tax=Streptomyces sp. SAS_267 TaxID=3412750 RepID=UPI00403C126F